MSPLLFLFFLTWSSWFHTHFTMWVHMVVFFSFFTHACIAHHTCLYCPRTFLSPQIRSKTSHPSHPFVYKRRCVCRKEKWISPFIHKWMAGMACFRSDLRAEKSSWAAKTSVMCCTSMCEKGKEGNHVHPHCEVCMKSWASCEKEKEEEMTHVWKRGCCTWSLKK